MPEVTYHDLDKYLPSRMTPTKMAEVTYIDLNKYIIVHRSQWVDPSGESHTVEYRARQYPPPEVDRYQEATLEKWQDGVLVDTLSASQLFARIQHWTYAPEPAIDVQVWRQLGTRNSRNYDVCMQWKQNDGGDIHLVEIIKYHMASTFDDAPSKSEGWTYVGTKRKQATIPHEISPVCEDCSYRLSSSI
jgi:hypothetical protein